MEGRGDVHVVKRWDGDGEVDEVVGRGDVSRRLTVEGGDMIGSGGTKRFKERSCRTRR